MLGFLIGTACLLGLIQLLRGGRRHWHHGGHRRGVGRWFLRGTFERLGTSPGQEKVIIEALDRFSEAVRGARHGLLDWRADVARAMRADDLDQDALKVLFLRQDGLIDEVQKAGVVSLSLIHEALTPRQRTELADWIERGGGRGHAGLHWAHS
jgi:Heavy-metal resistance